MNNPVPMQSPEQSIVEQKVLRWFTRYGRIVLPGAGLPVAYAIGLI